MRGARCPEGHHKSLIIYDEPHRVLHPASWLVSVTLRTVTSLLPEHTETFSDEPWGRRAEDFPFGWSSQAVQEGED